jgi:pimeloyl-ACP methyl ester carboxylesterase
MDPIVFLHGWGANSETWGGVSRFFETITDCVFVDFDCDPKTVMTLDEYADTAERIIAPLLKGGNTEISERGSNMGDFKINIVAHSFGARIAVLLAARHPEWIGRMVLTGAAGLRPRFSLRRWMRIKLYKWFKLGKGSTDYRRLSPEGKRTFSNIIGRDLAPEIARVTAPTLLLWGKCDKSTPIYMGKRWTKLCGSAILKTYPRAGHFAFIDARADFIRDAYKFLDGGK